MINDQEFLKIYETHSDAIFRHCYFRVLDREKAKDMTQETFIKTWQYLAKGESVDNIRAFLYRVATNLIIDNSRKKPVESLDQLREDTGFDPSVDDHQHLENYIDGTIAVDTLRQLESTYRDAIVMRYIDDLSPKEIAQVIGESENVVSVRIHRGLKKLKELLEPIS